MRIAMINPKAPLVHSNEAFRRYQEASPYLEIYRLFWSGFNNALLTLASITPGDRFDIVLIDENYQSLPIQEHFDIVALTATTRQAPRAYQIASEFKKNWGDRVLTVMGGCHVSFVPEEASRAVDVVFIGEAENSWPVFLSDVRTKKWKPVYRADDFPAVDLTAIPVPAYNLVDPDQSRMIWIQTSRGCPRDCEFCAVVRLFGRSFRSKTEDQVTEEIQTARRYLRQHTIMFSDDNLFCQGTKTRTLMEKIGRLGITFRAQADISIGRDPEYLRFLKSCGLSMLLIGFESVNEKNLSLINPWKRSQLDKYTRYIRNIAEAGIGIYGSFIIGYDWDTPESLHNLARFVTDNYIAGVQISILTPFPGTEIRARLEKENRLLDTGWQNYTLFDVNISHPVFGREELEEELVELYRKIYRPEYLAQINRYYKEIYRKMLVRQQGGRP